MNILNDANDNWIFSIIGSLAGAIFSGLVAILIFYCGGRREKKREKKRENIKRYEIESFLKIQVKSLYDASNRQVDSLKFFVESLKNDSGDNFEIELISGFNPSDLFVIELVELFKILVTSRNGDIELKSQSFITFKNNVLLLIDIKNDLEKMIIDFKEKIYLYESEYKKCIRKIIQEYKELGIRYENQHLKSGQDTFFENWVLIIDKWNGIDEPLIIDVTYENLIKPLQEIIRQAIENGDFRAIHIDNIVYDAIKHYNNYKKHLSNYHYLFSDLIPKILESNQKVAINFKLLINNKLKE